MTAQKDMGDLEVRLKDMIDSVRWFRNHYYTEQNRRIEAERKIENAKKCLISTQTTFRACDEAYKILNDK